MFQGRIYKITSLQTEKIYIGSTTTALNKRLSKHKSNYKRFQDGKYRNVSSFEIIQYLDAVIELIEEQEFKDKNEMLFRERHYIEIYECVNKMIPIRTNEEKKQYIIDNNEKVNEKKPCVCGGFYTSKHKGQHMKGKRHMNHTKTINITINITCQKVEIMKTE